MQIDHIKLIGSGMLPKELPPSFSTEAFSYFVRDSSPLTSERFQTKSAILGTHSLARPGGVRRALHIVHPFAFTNLTKGIETHWGHVHPIIDASLFSISKPTNDLSSRRALIPTKSTKAELTDRKIETRSRGRFLLKIDISRFYPSIYTHSIGWAIEGKPASKANRRGRSPGNELDSLLRQCQDDQTVGVPVGPDSSLAISELIASRIDEHLTGKGFSGFRFMDDYEIVCRTRFEAEKALDEFLSISSEYCLAPNPMKTKIYELPIEFNDRWTRKLADYSFSDHREHHRRDIINYFDLAFQYHSEFPNQGILPYAIKRLQQVDIPDSAWPTCRSLISQCILAEPACVRYASTILRSRESECVAPEIEDALNSIILTHGGFDHGSEVSWAIFLSQQLGISISSAATTELARSRDPIVRVAACFAATTVIADTTPFHHWKTEVTSEDSLRKEHWLLTYEAYCRGWNFLTDSNKNPVEEDANFSQAKTAGVSFLLDPQAVTEDAEYVLYDPYSDGDSNEDFHVDTDGDANEDTGDQPANLANERRIEEANFPF